MPRIARELTILAAKKIKKQGLHAVGGVAGLYLQVGESGAKSWILRASVAGKRRDIGLGGFEEVELAAARDKARELRRQIKVGVDPIAAKREQVSAAEAERRKAMTFRQAAEKYVLAKQTEWKNAKHAAQWQATLENFCFPVIGKLEPKSIELAHILRILEPHWQTKTETMTRVRGRIEAVLDWCSVRGLRSGDNPARWRGCLDKVLPAPGKIARAVHHRALAWADLPAFVAKLQKREGMAAKALEFLILTAARSGEVRGATWEEIDLKEKIWTISAGRMKAGREHRVPLSEATLKILKALPRFEGNKFIFPAARGGQLSDMALTALLRRMEAGCVAHGFRSTFRDWAGEATNYPREVAEAALAHSNGNKVEAAYLRTSFFDKRREMMNEWSAFFFSGGEE